MIGWFRLITKEAKRKQSDGDSPLDFLSAPPFRLKGLLLFCRSSCEHLFFRGGSGEAGPLRVAGRGRFATLPRSKDLPPGA